MFDVGFAELCLLMLLALLVLGPERLPKVARTAGRWVGNARRMLAALQDEISKETQSVQDGAKDLKAASQLPEFSLKNDLKNEMQSLQHSWQRDGAEDSASGSGSGSDSGASKAASSPEGHANSSDTSAELASDAIAPAASKSPNESKA